jgi:hypothetical protein
MVDISCAVVVPAGPADDTLDTLDSVLQYVSPPRRVIVVDDTGGRLAGLDRPDVDVIPAPPRAPGGQGGLWVKLCAGYRHALDTFDPDIILRLDADALMLGPGLVERAGAKFHGGRSTSHRPLGMLGSYRIGPDGGRRDWTPAARLLALEAGVLGLRRPAVRRTLRNLLTAATGYRSGEHPLGACYLHTAAAVRAMRAAGYLDLPELAASGLGEDHLFALATVAAGFRIDDFGGPDDPLAVTWKGLPDAPERLVARGKLVTHSVRSYGTLTEPQIRARFRALRA